MDRVKRFVELLKTDIKFQLGAALVVAAVVAAFAASR